MASVTGSWCRLSSRHSRIFAGWIVFNQFPGRWTLVGAAVIVAGGLYIVHREHRLRVRNRAALEALAKKL